MISLQEKNIWKVDAGDIASEPLIHDNSVYVSALYEHVDSYDLRNGHKTMEF